MSLAKKYIVRISLSLFVLSIFLGSCQRISDDLRAMLDNPASSIPLTTGVEVSRLVQDKSRTLGKPIRAKIKIEYEPAINHTQEDVFNELVSFLEHTNWKKENSGIIQSDFFQASLPHSGFAILVDVLIHSDRNIVSLELVTAPRE